MHTPTYTQTHTNTPTSLQTDLCAEMDLLAGVTLRGLNQPWDPTQRFAVHLKRRAAF